MKSFTQEQIAQWRNYEEVRSEGAFNMWSPQAIEATGLKKKDYLFVMTNFTDLKKAAEADTSSN